MTLETNKNISDNRILITKPKQTRLTNQANKFHLSEHGIYLIPKQAVTKKYFQEQYLSSTKIIFKADLSRRCFKDILDSQRMVHDPRLNIWFILNHLKGYEKIEIQ